MRPRHCRSADARMRTQNSLLFLEQVVKPVNTDDSVNCGNTNLNEDMIVAVVIAI